MSVDRRRGMIEAVHADLSISAQCRLLSISRSSFYYAPQPESEETLALMRVIDATFLDMPWYGSRQMVRHLRRQGVNIGRRRVQQLMTKMGLSPIYQRPRTSDPHPQHRIYPYLLQHLVVERPNQVCPGRIEDLDRGERQTENKQYSQCPSPPAIQSICLGGDWLDDGIEFSQTDVTAPCDSASAARSRIIVGLSITRPFYSSLRQTAAIGRKCGIGTGLLVR